MANHETKTDPWVDSRMAALVPSSDARPDTARALAILRGKVQGRRTARFPWRWAWALPVSAATLVAVLVPGSIACAQRPGACAARVWTGVSFAQTTKSQYKQLGSATAPITLEVYIDYQCPPCATFFQNVVPLLQERYIETGKLRVIFRDLPLPNHSYAKLAARYVNAAGELGYYAAAMHRIFETQSTWGKTGDVESQIALVVPPDRMEKLRDLVRHEPDTLTADEKTALGENLHQTPSAIALYNGRREAVAGDLTFDRLKAYLDALTL